MYSSFFSAVTGDDTSALGGGEGRGSFGCSTVGGWAAARSAGQFSSRYGVFEDMVLASAKHPAMLIYLDNFQSIGPGSRAARSWTARYVGYLKKTSGRPVSRCGGKWRALPGQSSG